MHKILEKALVKKYPNIFKDYGGDIRNTCMGWGMSCGKGWFLLIDELCSKLSDTAVALQVKEKLGGLRFYLQGTEEDHNIAHEYEAKSYEICETCGEPGERQSPAGWIRTICKSCDEKREIALKIRDGGYAYCFDEPGNITIFDTADDPDVEDPIFSGTFSEFIELMSPFLSLIEDPMSTTDKPLWERI